MYLYDHCIYIYVCVFTHTHWNVPQPKKKFLSFATAWMDLEGIMLSEINYSEKDKYHMISLICGM